MFRAGLLLLACAPLGCLEPVPLDPLGFRCESDLECGVGGACVLGTCRESTTRRALEAPHASGDTSVSIRHDAPEKWVALRWVARHGGILSRVRVRVKVTGSTG